MKVNKSKKNEKFIKKRNGRKTINKIVYVLVSYQITTTKNTTCSFIIKNTKKKNK